MSVVTTGQQWRQWVGQYTILPYIESIPMDGSRLLSLQQVWEMAAESSFILESGKTGRYTFLGLSSFSTIQGKGNEGVIKEGGMEIRHAGTPFQLVKQWLTRYRSPRIAGVPKFIGGCAGFWGYDVVRFIEKLPELASDDIGIPDYAFLLVDELWIMDHEAGRLFLAVHSPVTQAMRNDAELLQLVYNTAADRAARMKSQWEKILASNDTPDSAERHERFQTLLDNDKLLLNTHPLQGIAPAFKEEHFIQAVEQIQQYIAQGDVFQVNLSVRQSRKLNAEPEEIYEWLRLFNPSPYMGMLRFSGFHLVSASPELLVQLEEGRVRTRPIAGTRPRGASDEEDLRLAGELIENEKERAEHIMLVDLERNDLGKISKYGTVRVKDLMVIEKYSHVMHIVSEVQGELAEGKDAFDVIEATFPGGTITGAPKVRTMEIIEELEPVRRGPYTGSMGWIDYNGNMEFNIVIRTLLITSEGMGHIQAGAGIVIDSVPEKEYVESMNKAKALWKAIQYAEQWNETTGQAGADKEAKRELAANDSGNR